MLLGLLSCLVSWAVCDEIHFFWQGAPKIAPGIENGEIISPIAFPPTNATNSKTKQTGITDTLISYSNKYHSLNIKTVLGVSS